MKKIAGITLVALAIGFGFGCEKKSGGDNYSTPTEKIGSGEGDAVIDTKTDSAEVMTKDNSYKAERHTGAPEGDE